MIVAPHPDDETLATGGLLLRARAAGAAVRVVFVTDGDNNPWPQRLMERRVFIGLADRARFGRLRRGEALSALRTLGISDGQACFLSCPDQGITELLMRWDESLLARLAAELEDWKPTLLAMPALSDLHPDHSASNLLVQAALRRVRDQVRPEYLEYAVHQRGRLAHEACSFSLSLTQDQRDLKRQAILCHTSQLQFRRRSLLARARSTEGFGVGSAEQGGWQRHPICRAVLDGDKLTVEIAPRSCVGAFGHPRLMIVGWEASGRGFGLTAQLPKSSLLQRLTSGAVLVKSAASGWVIAGGRYLGNRRKGSIFLPTEKFQDAERVFVKLERRFGFFDEAGWREVQIKRPQP